MPDKFGGVLVEDQPTTGADKFGGIPVDEPVQQIATSPGLASRVTSRVLYGGIDQPPAPEAPPVPQGAIPPQPPVQPPNPIWATAPPPPALKEPDPRLAAISQGMENNPPPGSAPPNLPLPWETDLQTNLPPEQGPGFITGKTQTDIPQMLANKFTRGIGQAASGVEHMAEPAEKLGAIVGHGQSPGARPLDTHTAPLQSEDWKQLATGAHQAISGGFEAATPFMLKGALTSPLKTAAVLGPAMAAQEGVTAGLENLGLPQEYAEVAGDLTGILAGSIAHKHANFHTMETVKTELQKRWAENKAAATPPSIIHHQGSGSPVGTGTVPHSGEQHPPQGPPPPTKSETVSPATPNPPTASVATHPESPETIAIQMQQLGEGLRRVVMFPKGEGQPTQFPPNVAITHDEFGNTYAYRNDLTTKGEIHGAARNNQLSTILGGPNGTGAPDKITLPPDAPVVAVHAPDGTEVQATATSPESMGATVANHEPLVPPGGSVSVTNAPQVLHGRNGHPPSGYTGEDGQGESFIEEAIRRARGFRPDDSEDLGPRESVAAPEPLGEPQHDSKLIAEAEKPPHKFASTQIQVPEPLASEIRELGQMIPDEQLTEDGREDDIHVTVKYGLHADDPAKLQELLNGQPPITVTMGKTSLFSNDDADVVKIDVDSPELHALNKKIADAMPHTDTHPDYQPHITIAYVKPGMGKEWSGSNVLEGEPFTVNKLTFSGKDRTKTVIPLTGKVETKVAVPETEQPKPETNPPAIETPEPISVRSRMTARPPVATPSQAAASAPRPVVETPEPIGEMPAAEVKAEPAAPEQPKGPVRRTDTQLKEAAMARAEEDGDAKSTKAFKKIKPKAMTVSQRVMLNEYLDRPPAAPKAPRPTLQRKAAEPVAEAPIPSQEPENEPGPGAPEGTGVDSGSVSSGARPIEGDRTEVLITDEDIFIQARYEAWELADVQPSHNGLTFAENPGYGIVDKNERDYSQEVNQGRILKQSSEEGFKPRYHITDNPDAINGPPLLGPTGKVLGGNSRVMALQRIWAANKAAAKAYRELLIQQAGHYGLDPARIAEMKQPVLVRVASQADLDALPGQSKWAIRKTNVAGTAELTAAEEAAADAKQVTPEILDYIGSIMDEAPPDASLNDMLSSKAGTDLVNGLIDIGFFPEPLRPKLMDTDTGAVTEVAKKRIARALLGQYFKDADQLQRFDVNDKAIRSKLERIVGPTVRLSGVKDWDIRPIIQQAMNAIEYARTHNLTNLDDILSQQPLIGKKPFEDYHVTLAKFLKRATPNQTVTAFREYAAMADIGPMFDPPTPEEAIEEVFGEKGDGGVRFSPRPHGWESVEGRGLASEMRFEPIELEGKDADRAVAVKTNNEGMFYGTHHQAAGIHVPAAGTVSVMQHAAYEMDKYRDMGLKAPQGLRQLYDVAKQAYLEDKALVMVNGDSAKHSFDTVLRHELDHAAQANLKAKRPRVDAVEELRGITRDPLYRKAVEFMRSTFEGYKSTSDKGMLDEVGVRLMQSGHHADMGLTLEEARSLAVSYIKHLREYYEKLSAKEIADRVFPALRKGQSNQSADGVRSAGGSRTPASSSADTSASDFEFIRKLREQAAADRGDAGVRYSFSGPNRVKDFLDDEEGAFKGFNYTDAAAKMATRRAALAAVKAAEASPVQKDFGQRLIEWFVGERDSWVARVNQEVAKLKKDLPDATEQQAITLMRDFLNKKGALIEWVTDKHANMPVAKPAKFVNGKKVAEEVTPAMAKDYQARLDALKPAMRLALNPTPAMESANKRLDTIFELALLTGKKLGIIKSDITPEEYITHIFNPKDEGDTPVPLSSRVARAMGGKIGRRFAYANKRGYATVLDAVADGVLPRTLNAFDATTIYSDKFATRRATKLLENLLHDSGLGKWGTRNSDRIPKDWIPFAEHSTEFRNLITYPDKNGEPAAAEQRLMVPKYIDDALRPITDPNYLSRVPFFMSAHMYQQWVKAANLALSFFHPKALEMMALSNMGAVDTVKAHQQDMESAAFEAMERLFVQWGGITDILHRTQEAYHNLTPGPVPTLGEVLGELPALKQLNTFSKGITHVTFGVLQRKFKVWDFARQLAAWDGEHPGATPAERNKAGRSIAKQVNAVYGGLNWENLGMNKASLAIARMLILAPDWTFSNFVNVKQAAEGGPKAILQQLAPKFTSKQWEGSPAGKTARLFWIRAMLGGMAATQLLSLALTGKKSKRWTQVYMGLDIDGQEIYQNLFFSGAPGDLVNVLSKAHDRGVVNGAARWLAGKYSPLIRAYETAHTGETYLGTKINKPGMNPVAQDVRTIGYMARDLAPIPFSLMNAWEMQFGPKADTYTIKEKLGALVGGTPPAHVAPEGMKMTASGLKPVAEKEDLPLWQQIITGNAHGSNASDRHGVIGEIEKLVRAGKDPASVIAKGVKDGLINQHDASSARKRGRESAPIVTILNATMPRAIALYDQASKEDRQKMEPFVRQKLLRARNKPWEWDAQTKRLAKEYFHMDAPTH